MSIKDKQIELIESSFIELEKLKKEVTRLEEIRKEIEDLKNSNTELPIIFQKEFDKAIADFQNKFEQIKALSESYTKALGISTKNYLDGNNTLFTTKLNEFSLQIEMFKIEIGGFVSQIERLEKIDLEKHFDKLQKTLSEIFGAINAINLTLTAITQMLNNIVQSLGAIQNTIESNHKTTLNHLNDQDSEAKRNTELLESKIKLIAEQNDLLKKEIKTNRIIQVVGLTIILIILIYVAVKV